MDIENWTPDDLDRQVLKILKYEFLPYLEKYREINPDSDRGAIFEAWSLQQIANQRGTIENLVKRVIRLENQLYIENE